MKRRALSRILGGLALWLALAAQAEKVAALRFENQGPGPLDEALVASFCSVRPGDELDRAAVAKDVRALLASGHLSDVRVGPSTKTAWIFVFGNFAILIGVIWDMWFPLNKSLWTSSYVMFNAGMALLFFGMCYWLIDVKGIKWWTKPFVVYGMNAITVFALSGLVAKTMGIIKVTNELGEKVSLNGYLYNLIFVPLFSPINASLAWAICYILIWLGLMWILYAKKIFIKV